MAILHVQYFLLPGMKTRLGFISSCTSRVCVCVCVCVCARAHMGCVMLYPWLWTRSLFMDMCGGLYYIMNNTVMLNLV